MAKYDPVWDKVPSERWCFYCIRLFSTVPNFHTHLRAKHPDSVLAKQLPPPLMGRADDRSPRRLDG